MNMNPMVNAASVTEGEDVTTETDFVLNHRNYGGKPDISAIENTTQPENGTTYFVRTPETGGKDSNDGLSWATAFPTLRKALTQAKMSGVKNIWIAAGTYKESGTVNMVDGVNVYGGFKAYGNPESVRKNAISPTSRASTRRYWMVIIRDKSLMALVLLLLLCGRDSPFRMDMLMAVKAVAYI